MSLAAPSPLPLLLSLCDLQKTLHLADFLSTQRKFDLSVMPKIAVDHQPLANDAEETKAVEHPPLRIQDGLAVGLAEWLKEKDTHLYGDVKRGNPPQDIYGRNLITNEFWTEMTPELRESVSGFIEKYGYEKGQLKPKVYASRWSHFADLLRRTPVYRFLLPSEPLSEGKIENGLNFMALILALMLTIPYGALGSFDSDFLTRIRTLLANTPAEYCVGYGNTYDGILYTFISCAAMTIYSSVAGLVIIIQYYLLRPDSDYELRDWSYIRGRILMFTVTSCTICSIIGAMVVAAVMYRRYTVSDEEFCSQYTFDMYNSIFIPGMGLILFSMLFPIVLFTIPMK